MCKQTIGIHWLLGTDDQYYPVSAKKFLFKKLIMDVPLWPYFVQAIRCDNRWAKKSTGTMKWYKIAERPFDNYLA